MLLTLLRGNACVLAAPRRDCAAARCRSCRLHVCRASAGAAAECTLAQRDACSRYREASRQPQDRLVDDSFAVMLLGGDGAAQALAEALEPSCSSVVVARCFDAALLNAASLDGIRQLAVVGHGADTRAFRLLWPAGVRLFELGPHDALAHAELTFHSQGIRPEKSILLRRVAADVSGTAASGGGWESRLLAAGFKPDEATAWAVQGTHLLHPRAVETLFSELGSVAAIGSVVTGECALREPQLRTLLAQCGFQFEACESVLDVAAGLGRELLSGGTGDNARNNAHLLFSARKTRLTGVQHNRMQTELQRAEDESGEEGFPDAP